jgi:uncharacterized protein (TIGR03382 family)
LPGFDFVYALTLGREIGVMLMKQRWMVAAVAFSVVTMGMATSAQALSFDTLLTPFTGDDINLLVTLDDMGGSGDIKFTLATQPIEGDIVGFYFNINDTSLLPGLSAAGADGTPISDQDFNVSGVVPVGGGYNSMNGAGNIHVHFEGGVAIGGPGGGPGDFFPVASFILSHDTENLTLSLFEFVKMGARIQSVGEDREGSSKLVGETGAAPEPVTAMLALMGAGALGLTMRRRRAA